MNNPAPDAWYKSSCDIRSSLWGATATEMSELPSLSGEVTADVAVIGGGFCGLSAALHLAEQGVNVVLADAHEPGWGASGRNGGQVIPGLKIMPDDMVQRYGAERGERIAATAGSAPDLVYDLIARYGIDCDLRRTGWIQLAKGPSGQRTTDAHVDQWGRRGAPVRPLNRDDVVERVGTAAYVAGLIDDRGGNLHPLNYARGLARACLGLGVRIFAKTPALGVERAGTDWLIRTQDGSVRADKVIVCTNGYTGAMLPGLAQSVVPVLTGVVATPPLGDNLRSRILPGRQAAADTRRLLSWFGFDRDHRLLFGSRINVQREIIDARNFGFGLRRLNAVFPEVDTSRLAYMWTGRVALTLDHVPHIHELAEGLFSGLGFNGRGVAMATMFGKVLAGHAMGKAKADAFLPVTPMPRVPLGRLRDQGIAVALTWKRVMDSLRP